MIRYVSAEATLGPDVESADCAQILGKSWIGAGSRIGPCVVIGHPSKIAVEAGGALVIGNGATIGENSIIRSGTVIYENTRVGNRLQTGHNVVVREEVHIGSDCVLGNSAVVEPRARIGDNVRIQSFASVGPDSYIGNNVFVGPNVILTDKRYMAGVLARAGKIEWETIADWEGELREGYTLIVEDSVRIGSNSVLMVGIRIGEGAVIGAGSVVSRDVAPYTMVAGNPARLVRKIDPTTLAPST